MLDTYETAVVDGPPAGGTKVAGAVPVHTALFVGVVTRMVNTRAGREIN